MLSRFVHSSYLSEVPQPTLPFLAPISVPTRLNDLFPRYSFRTSEEYLISKDEITCSPDAQIFKYIGSARSPVVDIAYLLSFRMQMQFDFVKL